MKQQRSLSGEQKAIMMSIPREVIRGLNKLVEDKDSYDALRALFTLLMKYDKDVLTRNSGAISSLDTLINHGIDSSFRRGRLAVPVLLNGILQFIPKKYEELEGEEGEAKKKRVRKDPSVTIEAAPTP